MPGRLDFVSAQVGEMDELLLQYRAVHSDAKLIVDHHISISQQTRFTENSTKAKMVIELDTKEGIEISLDKLADHLERMAKAVRARHASEHKMLVVPTYNIRKGLI